MGKQRKIPNFAYEVHPDITMEDLCQLEDVVLICETSGQDTDGEHFYLYTIDGIRDGERIAVQDHLRKEVYGATVGGDVMIVHSKSRKEADAMAQEALDDTIQMLKVELEVRGTLEIGPNAGTIATVEEVSRRPH
jgi:hypothetical protein